MKPNTYYSSLSLDQRERYAQKAGTTLKYLKAHVFRLNGPTRTPGFDLLIKLALASDGNVSLDEALEYFYIEPVKAKALIIKADADRNYAERKKARLQTSNFNSANAVAL